MAATLLNERKPELLSRMAYGKSASQLQKAIQAVLDSAQAFEACAGERQSVTELRLALQRAQRRAQRLPGGPISSSTLVATSVLLDQLRSTAFRSEIMEDCRVEADECEFDEALTLHQRLQTASRLCDLHQERLAELADYYSNEEPDMVKPADTTRDDGKTFSLDDAGADAQPAVVGATPAPIPASASRPRVTVNVPPGGSKVSRQMIATLDSLGLPHRGGLLDVHGSDSGALADRLMEALDRRFSIRRDPVEGMRAVTRRYSAPEGSEGGDGALTGRMAVCAGTVAAGTKQMQVLLEDLDELLLGAEDWSVDEPERVEQRREEVLQELDRVRELAERPSGPPANHGDFHLRSLLRKLIQHHRALGFTAAEIPDIEKASDDWRDYPRPDPNKLKERLKALPEAIVEQTAALVDQSFWWFWQIKRQFEQLTDGKTDSEAAYHLRRVLTSAVPVIESVRIGIDENPGAAAWAGVVLEPPRQSIGVPAPPPGRDSDRYLSEELGDTLDWLEELAQTYGLSDGAYEAMTHARMRELEGALGSLESSLGDCIEKIETLNNPSDDPLLDQIRGLCLLVKSSRNLAKRLFPTTTA